MFEDKKLDIFIEVGEQLRFSEVAKRRYTTQPTISRQISALEEEWGMPLFVRTNKGLKMTPEGTIMLQAARKARGVLEAGLFEVRNMNRNQVKSLRLGFLESFDMERFFYPWLGELSEYLPGLNISIIKESLGGLRRGLEEDKVDVIYTLSFDRANMSGDIICKELANLKTMLAISEKHPLFAKENLSVNDCRNEIFFLPEAEDSPGREDDLRQVLRANGISIHHIRFVANIESALFQMKIGKGIALVDDLTYYDTETKYRTIPLKTGQSYLALAAMWKRENIKPQVAMAINSLDSITIDQ